MNRPLGLSDKWLILLSRITYDAELKRATALYSAVAPNINKQNVIIITHLKQ